MTTERLERVENDLDVVRQLLTSAATYAESANRKIDQLSTKVDQLTTSQDRTQSQLDQLTGRVDQLTGRVDQLSSRVDEFVFQSQRIFNQLATVAERADGRSERLEAIVIRLDRNYEEQKSQFREFQVTTNAQAEQDRTIIRGLQTENQRILQYLFGQQQGGGET